MLEIDKRIMKKTNDRRPGHPAWRLILRFKPETSLYVVRATGGDFDADAAGVGDFIDTLRNQYMGDIVPVDSGRKKPVQMIPILNLQRSMTPLTVDVPQSMMLESVEAPDLLNGLTLYINDECQWSCPMCAAARGQFLCCWKKNRPNRRLTIHDIEHLLKEVNNTRLHKLNISGGNIFLHPELNRIGELLNTRIPRVLKEYWFHCLQLRDLESIPAAFTAEMTQLNMSVHFPMDRNILEHGLTLLEPFRQQNRLNIQVVIQSEEDIAAAEDMGLTSASGAVRMIPFYNGRNDAFFRENVFITTESLRESALEMNDVLERTVLNTNYFRKLTITADKAVYANINERRIGILGKKRLMEMVFNALHRGSSWTGVRKKYTPCKGCAYNAMCPPISGYEYAIGRYNLCVMEPDGA